VANQKPDVERVRELRLARGWSQEQLAKVAGLSPRTIQRLEAGEGTALDTLQAIAAAFDVEVSEVLAAEKPLPPPPKITFLPRIRTGEELCSVLGAAHMFHQDYDPPTGQDDVEPMSHVQWAHDLGQSLREIEAAGFRVYAPRVTRTFRWPEQAQGAGEQRLPMDVATVLVLRNTNLKIMTRRSRRHRSSGSGSTLQAGGWRFEPSRAHRRVLQPQWVARCAGSAPAQHPAIL
jgi:transcriptional regulator with XRE-family HTH domain